MTYKHSTAVFVYPLSFFIPAFIMVLVIVIYAVRPW